MMFSCFEGHHQLLTLKDVRSSSLADGLPKDVVCFVPKTSGDDNAVLSITIDTELAYDDEKLEDEDSEDESYDENEDADED
jgi:E3 ubiquitin-protein ligase SIAH1